MTKFTTINLTVKIPVTNINSLAMIRKRAILYQFLHRVGVLKLFCSLIVSFSGTFCGAFYFVKDLIKAENDALVFN